MLHPAPCQQELSRLCACRAWGSSASAAASTAWLQSWKGMHLASMKQEHAVSAGSGGHALALLSMFP